MIPILLNYRKPELWAIEYNSFWKSSFGFIILLPKGKKYRVLYIFLKSYNLSFFAREFGIVKKTWALKLLANMN